MTETDKIVDEEFRRYGDSYKMVLTELRDNLKSRLNEYFNTRQTKPFTTMPEKTALHPSAGDDNLKDKTGESRKAKICEKHGRQLRKDGWCVDCDDYIKEAEGQVRE